jgi:OTU domain-containing protein 3
MDCRYHSWEHYSSVRNIDGPSQGPPEIKDRVSFIIPGYIFITPTNEPLMNQPIEQSVSSEPTAKEKEVLNACPNASLSQVRKMLITRDQDVDEAIEAIYEAEYQTSDPPPNDSIAQPKLDEAPIQESEAAASPPGRTFSSGLENANDADGLSQESGADDNKKRKRMTARDRQMQAKMKQKQQRKAKKKAVDDEQQEAKVTSELRQLYI